MTSRHFQWLMVALLLVGFWLRLDRLDTWPPGVSLDEAGNVMDAYQISETGKYPVYENPARPEPLYQGILAIMAFAVGPGVWTMRLVNVYTGLLTLATLYWTARQCLYDRNPTTRGIAGLAAAAALAVALSHVVLSRSIYRAGPQPLFTLLFAGLLLRGLRTGDRRLFVLSGASLAATFATYTAALIVPAALAPLALALVIVRRKTWRRWLPNLVWLGVTFSLLVAPVGWRFLHNRDAVLGRTQEIDAGDKTLERRAELVWEQFFTRGDINPQYNADSAPLLPPVFDWLFRLGLLALLVRLRQPSSVLIAALLALSIIPAAAANELPHGLRIAGAYAAFPLVIAAGVALILALAARLRRPPVWRLVAVGMVVALVAITALDARRAHRIYAAYWDKSYVWEIYDRHLGHGEWFFRTDKRDLGRWLAGQDAPLLVPLDELDLPTTRAWLLPRYQDVTTAGDDFTLPPGTRLVVPWWLERDDILRDTRAYGLLHDGTITLLPPLSAAAHARLLDGIDDAEAVTRPNGDLMARVGPVPDEGALAFEPRTAPRSGEPSPLAIFDNQIQLLGWRGPDTLPPDSGAQTIAYTLDWAAYPSAHHQYSAYLQLQTQDRQRLAGDDVLIWRWLYPSTLWDEADSVPDQHILTIPADLEPGAYRLVTGVYITVFAGEPVEAVGSDGASLGDAATIGWIKVPQRAAPQPNSAALAVDAALGEGIALRSAFAQRLDGGQIRLALDWEALVDRPALDATIFVHAAGPDGVNVAQDDRRPWGGQYPTFIWSAGERVRTEHVLDLGEVAPEDVTLRAGMYTLPDVTRLPVVQDGAPDPDAVVRLGSLAALIVD